MNVIISLSEVNGEIEHVKVFQTLTAKHKLLLGVFLMHRLRLASDRQRLLNMGHRTTPSKTCKHAAVGSSNVNHKSRD